MQYIRALLAAACAASVLAMTALAPLSAYAAEKAGAASVVLRAGQPMAAPTFVRPEATAVVPQAKSRFKVTYHGFTRAAKAAFQRAVNIWSTLITSRVPITVDATYKPLGTNILGSARPGSVWRNFPNAPQANTWFADALANKFARKQLNASPDIVANLSSNFTNWHFGIGAAPAGKYDFTTVVLHEIGHGLGFLGLDGITGGKGSIQAVGNPSAYDRHTENGAGKALLSFADKSAALAAQLKSNNLFFDSPQVLAANGNARARLYAPGTYQPGSSYSHLNEATYPPGSVNSLMTPILNPAETVHAPGPIVLAVFKTIGW
jgi:hypothetical protein